MSFCRSCPIFARQSPHDRLILPSAACFGCTLRLPSASRLMVRIPRILFFLLCPLALGCGSPRADEITIVVIPKGMTHEHSRKNRIRGIRSMRRLAEGKRRVQPKQAADGRINRSRGDCLPRLGIERQGSTKSPRNQGCFVRTSSMSDNAAASGDYSRELNLRPILQRFASERTGRIVEWVRDAATP